MTQLILEKESFAIRGAIFDVYREMGAGFVEPVYQECLEKELTSRGIPYRARAELTLTYKGKLLEQRYKPDFVCYEQIILELKAVRELSPEHQAQLLNYLKATGLKLGFLVNFSSYPQAAVERFVR